MTGTSPHRSLSPKALFLLSSVAGSLVAGLLGCGGSTHSIPASASVTIQAPANTTIDPSDSATLSATVTNDAVAGVTWSLSGASCTGAACGTLSNSTATSVTYTAPATVATAFSVTITATTLADSAVSATATLNIPINPAITTPPGALAGGTVGAVYTQPLSATGGIPPYTWSVSSGTLPVGLTLSASTGAITGIPTAPGAQTFTVQLADSGSPALTATATYSIAVAYPALAITTTTLPNATLGTTYTAALAASGGAGSGYTWTVTSGTGLSAAGLTLSSSGVISGIPTAAENAVPFTVQVTDAAGNIASATLTLSVINVNFQGQVFSGQLPVSGASLQIYATGATGTGSAGIPMLTQPVTTDNAGNFAITGLYTCGQSSTGDSIPATSQVYLVATGGTTSTTSPTSNAAISMVTAVGPCANLSAAANTVLNELTTAAAAWALSPFTTSLTGIGATATNTLGIQNAFLDAALLVNPAAGNLATLPTYLTAETGKLDALASALVGCNAADPTVNPAACPALFAAATPPSGIAPADTFTAALDIVQNPGQNVAAVFAAIPAPAAFPTTLTQSPNDWTLSLTVTGGGLSSPTALAIDQLNNVWVASQNGPLSAFTPQGAPLSSASPNGFGISSTGVPYISQVYGLTIDTLGNVWVTNNVGGSGAGSVAKFQGVSSGSLGTQLPTPSAQIPGPPYGYYDSSLSYPYALAADTNGNIFIANSGTNSATVYTDAGTLVSPALGASLNLNDAPNAIAVDANHGFWLSGDQNVAHVSSTGALLSNTTCCEQSFGMATDAAGDLWVADYLGDPPNLDGAFAEVVTDATTGAATVPISGSNAGGISEPSGVAVDSAQNVWFANRRGNSVTEIAGTANTLPTGTALSPSTGVYGAGGFGLDATLHEPSGLVPDRSGNLWVVNQGTNAVTMFFGLAAPTATPTQPIPAAP